MTVCIHSRTQLMQSRRWSKTLGVFGEGVVCSFVKRMITVLGNLEQESGGGNAAFNHTPSARVIGQFNCLDRVASGEFGEDAHGEAGFADDAAGAAGGVEGEAEVGVAFGDAEDVGAVGCFNADGDVAACGQGGVGGHLALGEGHAKVEGNAHDFASGLHFGAEDDVHAVNLLKGKTASLTL